MDYVECVDFVVGGGCCGDEVVSGDEGYEGFFWNEEGLGCEMWSCCLSLV